MTNCSAHANLVGQVDALRSGLAVIDGGDLDPAASGYPFGPLDLSTPDGWLYRDISVSPAETIIYSEPADVDAYKRKFIATGTPGEYQFVYTEPPTSVAETWAVWLMPSPAPDQSDYPGWEAGIRVDLEVMTTSVAPIELGVRVGETPYAADPDVIDQGRYGEYTVAAADGWVSVLSTDTWPYTKYDAAADMYVFFDNQSFTPTDDVFVRVAIVSLMGV